MLSRAMTDAGPKTAAMHAMFVTLLGAALFLGSFLMFLLEPMVARLLLPALGGAPMVWNGCVLFFQLCLLAGYGYSHGASRWLGLRAQTLAYAAILLIACAFLPVAINVEGPASGTSAPVAWLLATLAVSIGLPFFALTACAPGLQQWFSQTDHPASSDPYFLYAASNAGSLLALLIYPTVVAPLLTLSAQRQIWAAGFGVFAVVTAGCGFLSWRFQASSSHDTTDARDTVSVGWAQRLRWIALSCVPSSLLLAFTSYVTTDIAAVPLLWVVPLAIYLLTFVLAFGSRSVWLGEVASRRLPLFVTALAIFMAGGVGGPLWMVLPLHLLAFTLAALACHGRLAAERPPAAALTEYYFWLAFGGMLGGLFNTFAAPLLFGGVVEYPLALVAAAALAAGPQSLKAPLGLADLRLPILAGALTAALLFGVTQFDGMQRLVLPALGIPALLAFRHSRRPVRFAASLGAMLLVAGLVSSLYGPVLYNERTFFGVYRVSRNADNTMHQLYHGTTLHGVESFAEADRGEPLTYYHREGPFGQAFARLPALSRANDIGIIGLGVGSLAAYAGEHQQWTFYEIDPAVERIARNPEYFTHLETCGQRCRVVIGDARLSLEQAADQKYGLIVLDAFSSDAIPMHLITREAIDLYLERLTPDGVLAFHISNRHLDLGPVVANLASEAGLVSVEQFHQVSAEASERGRMSSRWIVLGRDAASVERLLEDPKWSRQTPRAGGPLWTDDFANILAVLRL